MSTSPTEILKLRREQIESRVREKVQATEPEPIQRAEREMAAILTRLRHRDTQAFMDEEMESELSRIAEEIKQVEEGVCHDS